MVASISHTFFLLLLGLDDDLPVAVHSFSLKDVCVGQYGRVLYSSGKFIENIEQGVHAVIFLSSVGKHGFPIFLSPGGVRSLRSFDVAFVAEGLEVQYQPPAFIDEEGDGRLPLNLVRFTFYSVSELIEVNI